mmetsp:Transcript_57211/g.134144  ORF Transcript_57211/g.134144 Transcript_57211/m.134144 type:complete len:271 (+) Transcript_57211:2041-2853(+)
MMAAGLRVARLHLGARERIAGLASRLRLLQNLPGAARLPSVAGLVTDRPLCPVIPQAVCAVAVRRIAGLHHGEIQITATAALAGSLTKVPLPRPVTNAAGRTAAGPFAPFIDRAISLSARCQGTALRLDEGHRARLTAICRILRDLTVAHLLTAAASLVTLVPLRPRGDLAIHPGHAADNLAQGSHTRQTRVGRLLRDASVAELHRTILTGCPSIPLPQNAVSRPTMTRVRIALHCFGEPVVAGSATPSGRLVNLPGPRHDAAVTGGCAS